MMMTFQVASSRKQPIKPKVIRFNFVEENRVHFKMMPAATWQTIFPTIISLKACFNQIGPLQ